MQTTFKGYILKKAPYLKLSNESPLLVVPSTKICKGIIGYSGV